jgi:hypothetical protein
MIYFVRIMLKIKRLYVNLIERYDLYYLKKLKIFLHNDPFIEKYKGNILVTQSILVYSPRKGSQSYEGE